MLREVVAYGKKLGFDWIEQDFTSLSYFSPQVYGRCIFLNTVDAVGNSSALSQPLDTGLFVAVFRYTPGDNPGETSWS